MAVQGPNVYVGYTGAAGDTLVAKLDAGTGDDRVDNEREQRCGQRGSGVSAGVAANPSGTVYVTGENVASQAFVASSTPPAKACGPRRAVR